ncbi:hypothetical protein EFN12_03785 [Pediococcus pentosaceus]|uniref:hypothetical protein n=1 Tax=Pediococcus pentosaceus TaxID=1255 RepID=UPI0021A8A0BB|nr:hypothetical protein [Pediococcus pentosaceus]MCT3023743.1 hypothetical protein [Pediococcus pentosaceus]
MKLKEKYNTWSFKKKIFAAVIAVILILLILMCIVDIGILLINGSFVIGTDGDWISFWGSAIGSLLGIIGAVGVSYWSTRKQLIESKKNDFENQIKLADLSRLSEALTILKNAMMV